MLVLLLGAMMLLSAKVLAEAITVGAPVWSVLGSFWSVPAATVLVFSTIVFATMSTLPHAVLLGAIAALGVPIIAMCCFQNVIGGLYFYPSYFKKMVNKAPGVSYLTDGLAGSQRKRIFMHRLSYILVLSVLLFGEHLLRFTEDAAAESDFTSSSSNYTQPMVNASNSTKPGSDSSYRGSNMLSTAWICIVAGGAGLLGVFLHTGLLLDHHATPFVRPRQQRRRGGADEVDEALADYELRQSRWFFSNLLHGWCRTEPRFKYVQWPCWSQLELKRNKPTHWQQFRWFVPACFIMPAEVYDPAWPHQRILYGLFGLPGAPRTCRMKVIRDGDAMTETTRSPLLTRRAVLFLVAWCGTLAAARGAFFELNGVIQSGWWTVALVALLLLRFIFSKAGFARISLNHRAPIDDSGALIPESTYDNGISMPGRRSGVWNDMDLWGSSIDRDVAQTVCSLVNGAVLATGAVLWALYGEASWCGPRLVGLFFALAPLFAHLGVHVAFMEM